MKILAIRGKNLASLAGEFDIDFQSDPLRSAGLFAITGPTGAGKSTLLDALCLALYERTPRLARASGKGEIPDVGDNGVSPADPRTILRRGAAEGFAEVDYVGSDSISYRARWSVRRSRNKSDGKLQHSEVSFVRLLDKQVLGDHRKTETLRLIETSIGLNFDQFTRAVLLAQNEFAAFLRASDDERAELLQTLTGTETFTLISQQAFARMKAEKEQLDRLQVQMQDQTPLTPELRAEKEAQLMAQDQAARALEARKSLHEGYLRWYAQLDSLGAAVTDAQGKLDSAVTHRLAAAPRHGQLSTVERVQPARPLCAEQDRLNTEVVSAEANAAALTHALEAHALTVTACAGQQAAAAQQVVLAKTEIEQAQPLLLKARELDATMAALAPQWRSAELAKEQAAKEHAAQDARKADVGRKLAQAGAGLTESQAWLSANEALRPLSEHWPRWETLFGNAKQHLTRRDQAAAEVKKFDALAKTIAQALLNEQLAMVEASATLSAAQQQFDSYSRACTAVDPEQLAHEKARVALRREHLLAAAHLWLKIGEDLQKKGRLEQQREEQAGLLLQGQAQQREGALLQPSLEHDLMAAQLSLDIANLAASSNAKSMRASLQPDGPCPVCGATDHPYAEHSPQSDAIVGALRAQVSDKRRALDDLLKTLATAAAQCKAAGTQITQIERDLLDLQGISATHEHKWQTQALHAELVAVSGAGCSVWLSEQRSLAEVELQRIGAQEESYRELMRQKDLAQAALAPAQLAVEKARAAIDDSTLQQHKTAQKLEFQQQNCAELTSQLSVVQGQIDGAFEGSAWRGLWALEPQPFVDACRDNANNWALRHQQVVTLGSQIQTLQAELGGCENACVQAAQQLKARSEQARALGEQIGTQRAQRDQLFDARPTAEVEAALRQGMTTANNALLASQEALGLAQSEGVRMTESVHQANKLLERLRLQLITAASQLEEWISTFNAVPESDALSADDLRRMLAISADWIAQERQALQAIDSTVASAQAVLREHQQAMARHEADKTVQQSADELREGLEATVAALTEASQSLTAVKIAIAQDDDKLNKSAALRADIEKQSTRARVWSQLSELIGSADGKKFRNFAQQLTLDILLSFANQHLQNLSRRYRLQRITDSLGLLVVDQDMGDEVRSVHSLSGGESFLVSLALALGLASLSSHRVCVESLFIDEGFGSLDADSLRVAMDALDNLQALGRKVGVISHVQEMTERISTRINVQRMAGGQSKVTIAG